MQIQNQLALKNGNFIEHRICRMLTRNTINPNENKLKKIKQTYLRKFSWRPPLLKGTLRESWFLWLYESKIRRSMEKHAFRKKIIEREGEAKKNEKQNECFKRRRRTMRGNFVTASSFRHSVPVERLYRIWDSAVDFIAEPCSYYETMPSTLFCLQRDCLIKGEVL